MYARMATVAAAALCAGVGVWKIGPLNARALYHHSIGIDHWDECATPPHRNRTHALYQQLVKIHTALDRCGVPHYLTYGSLIGAMRDNAINRFEVDNDIALPGGRVPLHCSRHMRDNGIVLVDGRACTKASTRTGSFSPFQSYYAYTDFYTLDHGPPGYFTLWNVSAVAIGAHQLPAPPRSVATPWLDAIYSDWEHPPARPARPDVV